MIQEGRLLPRFTLKDTAGRLISPDRYLGRRWVLFFYPRDMTPGCTREACEFSLALARFHRVGATVVGVSGGSLEAKRKFKTKNNLKIGLLADEDYQVARRFGVYGEKKLAGKTVRGITRTTILVGPDGRIEKIWPRVKVEGHVEAVLEETKRRAAGVVVREGEPARRIRRPRGSASRSVRRTRRRSGRGGRKKKK